MGARQICSVRAGDERGLEALFERYGIVP